MSEYDRLYHSGPNLSDVPMFGFPVQRPFEPAMFDELGKNEHYYVVVHNYTTFGDDCPILLTPELLMDCDLFQIDIAPFAIIRAQEYGNENDWMECVRRALANTANSPDKIQMFTLRVAFESLPKTHEECRRVLERASRAHKQSIDQFATPIVMMED